jgi:predicted flap endonuclease-1-like 5' DNA nuclease
MTKKYFNKRISAFFIAALMVVLAALVAVSANALTDTIRPTILSVSAVNNERSVPTNKLITVVFSEDMNPSTINADTFAVMQRTTPELGEYRSIAVDGAVTYNSNDRTATFTSNERFAPDQQYGNVFTVMITTGARDLAGNSLSRNYVWSFTTGGDLFNTGATTSQLDQSLAPNSGSAAASSSTPAIADVSTPTVVAAPVAGAQAATESRFPWVWVIGGLLLLLLMALILSLTMTPTPQKNKKSVQAAHSNPFGDVHPVIDLEGIGPEYSKRLHAMGIKNTKQLWETDTAKIARMTGAPLNSVKSWQNMAELASVHDIGPQYAELLERSGIHSITQLKDSNPNKLLKLVRKKQDSLKINIQGNSPGHATVEHWIAEARDHRFNAPEELTA